MLQGQIRTVVRDGSAMKEVLAHEVGEARKLAAELRRGASELEDLADWWEDQSRAGHAATSPSPS